MAESPQQQQATMIGAAILGIFLLWWHCRKNPPGLTCNIPHEPMYPALVITPPPSPPPPRHCLEFPGKDTPPFPCCYTSIDSSPNFPEVKANGFTFVPQVTEVRPGKGSDKIFAVNGWIATQHGDPSCDQRSHDPSFGGRFHLVQNPDECGGIYGC